MGCNEGISSARQRLGGAHAVFENMNMFQEQDSSSVGLWSFHVYPASRRG